jgi:endonuclease III-like uncharacterized protein
MKEKRTIHIEKIYKSLLTMYGPQHWWPADTAFEVMVGAILTQNTAWINIEKAIANLKQLFYYRIFTNRFFLRSYYYFKQ